MGSQQKKVSNSKALVGFWPLFALVIVSAVLGAIIYSFAQGNILQDEVNASSGSFLTKLGLHPVLKKPAVKTNTTSTHLK